MMRLPEAQIAKGAYALLAASRGMQVEDLNDHDRMSALTQFGDQARAVLAAAGLPPLPHSIEAEHALLGALLYDNTVYERLPEGISEATFFEAFHGSLWAEIEKAIRQGLLADPTLMATRFANHPAFEAFGGFAYLALLVDRAPPSFNARDYALTLLETQRRRDLLHIGSGLICDSADGTRDSRESGEAAEAELFRTLGAGLGPGQGVVSFQHALTGAVEMAAAAYGRDGALSGLATELADLDQKLGGLHPSDLLIVAGRPSMGKTALATNIAFNIARRYRWEADPEAPAGQRTVAGGRVLFYSLEMSAEQLALRVLADAAGVSGDRIRKGEIDAADYDRIREAAIEIGEAPLYIDATGGLGIAKLAARARRQMRKTGLDLIVVDYLQLVTVAGLRPGANRVEIVAEITGGLKALAKELNVPIIALSQLSRQVEQREDKRPQLSDLRESGSIEQDADCVMFVYREAYYLERAEPKEGSEEHLKWQEDLTVAANRAEVIVGKARHGPIGSVLLAFSPDLTRFGNLAADHYNRSY